MELGTVNFFNNNVYIIFIIGNFAYRIYKILFPTIVFLKCLQIFISGSSMECHLGFPIYF